MEKALFGYLLAVIPLEVTVLRIRVSLSSNAFSLACCAKSTFCREIACTFGLRKMNMGGEEHPAHIHFSDKQQQDGEKLPFLE